MMQGGLLQLEGVSKSFGANQVIQSVDLNLHAGCVQALIGPNGAGKSTLVSLICGQHKADAGRILLDGQSINKTKAYERTRKGLVRSFQISSVFLPLTVEENIAMALLSRQSPHFRFFRRVNNNTALMRQARETAEQFGLQDTLNERAENLSHGGRRLLELAMTMALTPRVLLLDEPMAGLSAVEIARVSEIIERVKTSRAVLLIEHDLPVVYQLADQVAVLVDGKLIANDTVAGIQADPAVQKAYLHDGGESATA